MYLSKICKKDHISIASTYQFTLILKNKPEKG